MAANGTVRSGGRALDTARLVLDYFEVLVWPGVVAGLVATVLVLFRPQIADLIPKLRKLTVGPSSAQFGAGPQAAPEREEATDEVPEEIAEIVRPDAEELEHDYQSRLVDLYDRFAATDFYWFCEKVYRTIYGSQIRLLENLQARGVAGASVGDLLPFFLQHLAAVRQVNPAYEGRFDAYMGYLSASQLVMQDPSAPSRYRIAPRAVGFLAYLPWAGIPPQKPW